MSISINFRIKVMKRWHSRKSGWNSNFTILKEKRKCYSTDFTWTVMPTISFVFERKIILKTALECFVLADGHLRTALTELCLTCQIQETLGISKNIFSFFFRKTFGSFCLLRYLKSLTDLSPFPYPKPKTLIPFSQRMGEDRNELTQHLPASDVTFHFTSWKQLSEIVF